MVCTQLASKRPHTLPWMYYITDASQNMVLKVFLEDSSNKIIFKNMDRTASKCQQHYDWWNDYGQVYIYLSNSLCVKM